MKYFYITTPIYYVNAEPHLGHAYTTLVADVENRFHKMCGEDTFFLTGTDEHGDKIVQAAQKEGMEPKEYVDRISKMFQEAWPLLNIKPDHFIRTTDPEHIKTVQYVLNKVYESGDIAFREYEGLYCFGCERFYMERELIDGKCPDHGTEPVRLKEKNYFFLMSKYQDWLIDHIKKNPDFITPERYRNEVLSFLKEPLDDLCISRPTSRLTWGIPLPFDENFVTYVWFDALINYLTAVGYPDGDEFKKRWPAVEHVIAKDILKPHAIYWPCMLKAIGVDPPRRIHVHGYWQIKDQKMSKSLGNVIKPKDLVDTFGVDATRYCLLREMAFGLDASFSQKAMTIRVNADLANDLGNLVSRIITMLYKYRKGVVPQPDDYESIDRELISSALSLKGQWLNLMEEFSFHRALSSIWEFINKVNKYIDTVAPWALFKEDKDSLRLNTVLYVMLESLRFIAIYIYPVMPETSEKIFDALGLNKSEILTKNLTYWQLLPVGSKVNKIKPLFPRMELEDKNKDKKNKIEKDKSKKKEGKKMEDSADKADKKDNELIDISLFQKVDLRVAQIIDAEKHPNADKLLKLKVKCPDERTIVAGIAEAFPNPKELIGKQVIVVSNLKPVKLRGIMSYGMLLVAKDKEGIHLTSVLTPAEPGTKIS